MKRIAFIFISLASGLLLIRLGLTAFAADMSPAVSSSSTKPAGWVTSRPASAESGHWSSNPPRSIAPSGGGANRALPMPREYAILMTRSMFVRGHMAEAGHLGGHTTAPPANTQPSLAREETSLVFNGVTQTATTIDALVEDTESGRVLTVHSGDAVAKGSVGKITMDTLEYVRPSGTITVRIGQNFSGSDTDLSTVPTPTGPTPAGSGASPQDILERLRQKRLQELGGH